MKIKLHKKLNNAGVSLIELIIVIAMISILTGGVGIGISLAFSRDASQCAIKLNDAIYDARMLSMTKSGDSSLTISKDSGSYKAEIKTGTNTKEILLGDGKIESIKYDIDGGTATPLGSIIIVFDKSKGNVLTLNGTPCSDSILTFTVKQSRGDKQEVVQLVTSTGKHTVGSFD